MKTKVCFKCNVEKSLNEFYAQPGMADGHLGKCKACTKRDVRKNYAKHREQYAEYERVRFQKPERKAYALEYQRRYRAANPEKYKARSIVHNVIRDGKLTRQSCEVCGDTESEAHHDDYSRPLEVRWLCFKHHRELHGQDPF